MLQIIVNVIFILVVTSSSQFVPNRRQNSKLEESLPTPLLQDSFQSDIIESVQGIGADISYDQWQQGQNGNVVLSPLSIASLLSLLLLASKGESQTELERIFHFPSNVTQSQLQQAYENILKSTQNNKEGVEVNMDSRLFLQNGLSILGQFTQMAERTYGSKVRGLDFEHEPTKSMNTINKWVEKATHGKITELITQPFARHTKFVAANVIYFNGEWEIPFSQRMTENGIFNTGTEKINIPMMINLMRVPFTNHPDIPFDMISLPYKGERYSMIIITPKDYSGLDSLRNIEIKLHYDVLEQLIKLMEVRRVSVKIPRMKIRDRIFLKKTLTNLGASAIFDGKKADFSSMTSVKGIFIDDIVHEAVLEITEAGTTAAAASAAAFDRLGGNDSFHLDKPSLIFIRDNTNGLILFSARVMKPEPIFRTN